MQGLSSTFETIIEAVAKLRDNQDKIRTKMVRLELQNYSIQKENEILHEQLEKLNKKLNGYRRH